MNVNGDIGGILRENIMNACAVIKGKNTLVFITEHITLLTPAKYIEIKDI
jgi:hypothetical protein